jgi:hypothetical protein
MREDTAYYLDGVFLGLDKEAVIDVLRDIARAQKAEIADLKTELSGTLAVNDVANQEIARLRKVAEAAREVLGILFAHVAYPCGEIDDLANALAELDGGHNGD